MAMSRDWWVSGWHAVLPRQGLFIDMVVSTATVRDVHGDFSTLVSSVGFEAFELNTGGLQEPVWWSYPDAEEDDEEQRAIDLEMQREFESTMTRAGLKLPETVLDLALLMADLGLYERTAVNGMESWRKVIPTPLASETLPVSEAFSKSQDESRWSDVEEESAQLILRYVIDVLDSPPKIESTLKSLADHVGLEVPDLRFGLTGLLSSGFEIVEPLSLETIDPESVDEEKEIAVLVDWLVFAQDRIGITFSDPTDGDKEF
jgi:hypothetical protein